MRPGSSAQPTLYLVDASLYVFRAWHSMPDEFQDADGWPTNAVHGFARFLLELLERSRPQHIVVAFDEALDSCFRNALYPAYKANRDPAPEELRRQFAHCKALCLALGLVVLAHAEYEADDLIGSAARAGRAHGHRQRRRRQRTGPRLRAVRAGRPARDPHAAASGRRDILPGSGSSARSSSWFIVEFPTLLTSRTVDGPTHIGRIHATR